MNKNNWEIAQIAELDCWMGNKKKVESEDYLVAKKNLWREIIDSLSAYFTNDDLQFRSVLEFGCGPAGVFLLVKQNPNFICLDPLMSQYFENFTHIKSSQVKFVDKKIEDFITNQKFNIILGFNSLDHVDNISNALKILYQLSSKETTVVLIMNVHNYKWIQIILKFAYPILDKLHKHQYTSKQYLNMFKNFGFSVVDEHKVDNSLQRFVESLDKNKNNKRTKIKPANLFFGLLRLFGLKRYGYEKPKGKSVYSSCCFVLKIPN